MAQPMPTPATSPVLAPLDVDLTLPVELVEEAPPLTEEVADVVAAVEVVLVIAEVNGVTAVVAVTEVAETPAVGTLPAL